ncbi:MAG TPA: GDSL-type esterase/lipase family protein [Chthoniobacteraceae bacterium]|nr:GDSL-type esterase/lipase family protein [Chthoniobacteraceae bacterium]
MKFPLPLAIALAFPLALSAADTTPAPAPDAVRIACIGDTITDMSNYPKVLAQFLSTDYELAKYHAKSYDVRNYGVPDTTVVMTEKPWIKTPKADDAKAFLPQIVVIEIGTQDTQKGKNWDAIATFPAAYKDLINQFASLSSKPKIYLCLPPPIYGTTGWGMSEDNLTSTVIPDIKQVAKELNLPVIDLHTALGNRPDLFDHSVHPTGDAKKYIAAAVYTGILGIDPPGALVAAPSTFPGKNLLADANPGAESDTPAWINKGGAIAFETDTVHGGKRAVVQSGRTGEGDSLGLDITAALNASGTGDYCFRIFSRLAADTSSGGRKPQCWAVITYTDDKGVHTITGPKQNVSATDWTPCGGAGVLHWTGTLKSATLSIASSAKDNLILDDAELGKFTYAPPAQ